jgi:hypothetical protein
MNLYDATIPIFTKYLRNLERWIDKATAYAAQKKFDPENFVQARLAIDQYPFAGQVQSTCDAAKFCAAKMTGKDAPSDPDTEKTLAELRARVRKTVEYLATFKPQDFVGCEDRPCQHRWMEGKSMRGGDYLDHYALPTFHFHLTIAYSILRHNGVDVGIDDFLGDLPLRD